MYKINWSELTAERFMREYWQKKPLLIKQGFNNFVDPISADELAGLAMEEDVESRIVAHQNNQWQVLHGPFDDYHQFGEQNWTLLVQATNNWHADVQQLIKPFQFIPNWRIDDVMTSFSCPGGGVGPHLDQYDVFIIQGSGKRRWRVGLPDDSLACLLPHEDLKQVSDFNAEIDEITEPGDILYIPPNHPHDGVALEPSLNFSVGFQAPNQEQLWSAFADFVIDNQLGEKRFSDSSRSITENPQEISDTDIDALQSFMQQLTSKHNITQVLGQFLTQNHHTLDLVEPEVAITPNTLLELAEDTLFTPVLGLKTLIYKANNWLFMNGDLLTYDDEQVEFVEQLAKCQPLTIKQLKSSEDCLKNSQLLTRVINMGYWFCE